MKKKTIIWLFLLVAGVSNAQIPVDSWREHFTFLPTIVATQGNGKVFAASAFGIFSYNSADGTIGKITRINGLSDVGISAIAYSPYKDLLLVGYENGNVDLVYERTVINIPYILQKPMSGSKRINHFFCTQDDKAYISTGFGIVALNLEKNEILDTYFIGSGGSELWVNQVVVHDNMIYAATANGLFYAPKDDPLLIHYDKWSVDVSIPNYQFEISALVAFNGQLVLSQIQEDSSPDVIWYKDDLGWTILPNAYQQIRNLWASDNSLTVCSRQGISIFQNLQTQPMVIDEYPGYGGFKPNYALVDGQDNIIVAGDYYALMYKSPDRWIQVSPNSPSNSRAYYVLPTETDVLVVGGSRNSAWGNMWYPLTLHSFSNQSWSTFINSDYFDPVRIIASPFAKNEYYVGSWGHGVIVYKDGEITEWYNPENSSLETVIPGAFCRIGGMVFDKNNNLWVTNAGVNNALSMRTPEGTWKGFPYLNQIGSNRISDIYTTPWGHLWVVLPSGGGLFVVDPGDSPEIMSSHKTQKLQLKDKDGASLSNDVFCLAFDRDDYLWIGTSEGVVVSYNPEKVFEPGGMSMQRIKVPDILPGYAAFLLEYEAVTSIAIDGANRKWFGTSKSGVFLQSADGVRAIKHFTKENSPLPSNTINHLAIHPKTGEVFIVTDMGIVSYRGDATEPEEIFKNVYAFPNPVRPDYDGIITITGLMDKTNVKITDVAGNLVYETKSLGGQATWDGKNKQGERVATGVYLFFCADSKGEQSAVGKILFIR